jgi:hypothetical protein
MTDQPDHLALLLGDLLRASLDDERIKLPTLAEQRLVARMVELARIAGVQLVDPDRGVHVRSPPTGWRETALKDATE